MLGFREFDVEYIKSRCEKRLKDIEDEIKNRREAKIKKLISKPVKNLWGKTRTLSREEAISILKKDNYFPISDWNCIEYVFTSERSDLRQILKLCAAKGATGTIFISSDLGYIL